MPQTPAQKAYGERRTATNRYQRKSPAERATQILTDAAQLYRSNPKRWVRQTVVRRLGEPTRRTVYSGMPKADVRDGDCFCINGALTYVNPERETVGYLDPSVSTEKEVFHRLMRAIGTRWSNPDPVTFNDRYAKSVNDVVEILELAAAL